VATTLNFLATQLIVEQVELLERTLAELRRELFGEGEKGGSPEEAAILALAFQAQQNVCTEPRVEFLRPPAWAAQLRCASVADCMQAYYKLWGSHTLSRDAFLGKASSFYQQASLSPTVELDLALGVQICRSRYGADVLSNCTSLRTPRSELIRKGSFGLAVMAITEFDPVVGSAALLTATLVSGREYLGKALQGQAVGRSFSCLAAICYYLGSLIESDPHLDTAMRKSAKVALNRWAKTVEQSDLGRDLIRTTAPLLLLSTLTFDAVFPTQFGLYLGAALAALCAGFGFWTRQRAAAETMSLSSVLPESVFQTFLELDDRLQKLLGRPPRI
jgi:hypothetical protein